MKLRDVLADCGWDVDALALGEKMPPGGVKHVQMEGYDQVCLDTVALKHF